MKANNFARTVAASMGMLLLAAVVAKADERTIRCESTDERYRYCQVRTDNEVRLERQLSRTRCRENRNWGYDRHGVWVDRGCRAEFRVGRHDGSDKDKTKAVAAAAGLALVIGALVAKNNADKETHQDNVPPWAIGTFTGYDDVERTTVEVTIYPGGDVEGRAGSSGFIGHFDNDQLEAGRKVFKVRRTGNGFRATNVRDRDNTVTFQRASGGY